MLRSAQVCYFEIMGCKLNGMKQFGGDSNTHVVGKEHVKRVEELEELLGQLLAEGMPLPVLIDFHGTSFTVSEGYHCGSCFAEHEREPECEESSIVCGICLCIGQAKKLSLKVMEFQ